MKLILETNNKLKIDRIEDNWSKFGNENSFFLFKGYFFYKEEFYFKENLPKFILEKEVDPNKLNGCFLLLIFRQNKLRIILDRLDGSREIAFDLRTAWILTGAAINKGEKTSLMKFRAAAFSIHISRHLLALVWMLYRQVLLLQSFQLLLKIKMQIS